MQKRWLAMIAGGLFLGLAASARADEPKPKLPPLPASIKAVNVDVPMVVITGTVTVRVEGVLVNPADVTYSFDPEFKSSTGYLARVDDGIFVLHVDKVPADESYILTIRAAYNDTLIRDGVVERLGKTRTGSIRVTLPFGRDYDIGQQLLDLQ